jgi:hypothetical protein
MNTSHKLSVAQNWHQEAASHRHTRARKYLLEIALVIVFGVSLALLRLTPHAASATGPDDDTPVLYDLAASGNGEMAVQQLAALAAARGGWGPAPGDEVVYDALLKPSQRAATKVADYADDCEETKYDRPGPGCHTDFQSQQSLVRFGFFTFADETADGASVPRSVDDVLSVYIEEVGHSWQEYLFETEGRGTGERTRLTTAFESKYWAAGWEYQVKRYILSLDGSWLSLSDAERDDLKTSICTANGYANPTRHFVPAYGPPPGWPNPAGWPTVVPTREEFQAFCQGS